MESENEPGSVQIYPVGALEALCRSTKLSEPPADIVRTLVEALEEIATQISDTDYQTVYDNRILARAALAAAKDAGVL